jgi:integrase/predicted transcriptional regulator
MDVEHFFYRLTDAQRIEVVRCLAEKLGLSVSDIAKAAGVSKPAVLKWLRGLAAPQADKLSALHSAMPEAVAKCVPQPAPTRVEVDLALSTIARALADPVLKEYVLTQLELLLPGQVKRQIAYRVEQSDIELFRGKLKAEGLSGGTVSERVRYLVKFLNSVGWTLTPETVQQLYSIKSPYVMRKTAVAVKKFIKTVVRAKEPAVASLLYDSFRTPKVRARNSYRLPTLEEVRRVWEEAHKITPCTAAVWGLLAETGVRFDQLLRAPLGGLQLDKRRILLGETAGTKRQPLVFLTEGAAKYLRDVYLPWRQKYYGRLDAERLFPCPEYTIYNWLKLARERAGLPWLEPRLLRKFNAQYMLDAGADLADIAVLQGRALPSGLATTIEHYIVDYERRLRQVFDRFAPRVFPQ